MTEPIVLESNQNHATITDNGICPTLSASMGLGGGYVPMVLAIHEASGQDITVLDETAYALVVGGASQGKVIRAY